MVRSTNDEYWEWTESAEMLTYVLATMRRPGADTTLGGSPETVMGRGGPPPALATARQDEANLPLLVLG
jgi:hypothetical protein